MSDPVSALILITDGVKKHQKSVNTLYTLPDFGDSGAFTRFRTIVCIDSHVLSSSQDS